MIRTVLTILAAATILILAGVLAQMMSADPGVIIISWLGYVVETTFWGGIGVLLGSAVIILGIVVLIRLFWPRRLLSKYRQRRDRAMAKKETLVAIDSWLSGDDTRAITALERVAQAGGSDRLPKAVSLAIGFTQGDWLDRYADLIKDDPELKRFAHSLMAERLWQNQKSDEFIELMHNHFDLQQIVWLRERYWNSLLAQGQATDLVKLVSEAAHINPEIRQQWLLKAVHAALTQVGNDDVEGQKVLKNLSKSQRQLPEVVNAEILHLMRADRHDAAFKRLKTLLSAGHLEQSDLLIHLKVNNLQKLNFLEALEPSQPGVEFCRAAGVLNLNQQLWGNAQSWLEKGWTQGDRECGVHLAELFEQRNMHDQANRLYRQLATNLMTVG